MNVIKCKKYKLKNCSLANNERFLGMTSMKSFLVSGDGEMLFADGLEFGKISNDEISNLEELNLIEFVGEYSIIKF